ncbi:hypothetical protein MMC19_004130 [Ptychographa xylographoides]|nr:hypothetical protein [Ptychographa xylographoides]
MATTEIITVQRRRKYHWPEAQLNFWLLIIWVASGLELGVFATFMTIQTQLGLGTPWLFPYMVTVAGLAIIFLVIFMILIMQRQLLPGIVIVFSGILFVLWLAGLIETAIQFLGPSNVNGNCNLYILGQPFTGVSLDTFAYLEQKSICQSWQAAFSFLIIGCVFYIWMIVMASQVNQDQYE